MKIELQIVGLTLVGLGSAAWGLEAEGTGAPELHDDHSLSDSVKDLGARIAANGARTARRARGAQDPPANPADRLRAILRTTELTRSGDYPAPSTRKESGTVPAAYDYSTIDGIDRLIRWLDGTLHDGGQKTRVLLPALELARALAPAEPDHRWPRRIARLIEQFEISGGEIPTAAYFTALPILEWISTSSALDRSGRFALSEAVRSLIAAVGADEGARAAAAEVYLRLAAAGEPGDLASALFFFSESEASVGTERRLDLMKRTLLAMVALDAPSWWQPGFVLPRWDSPPFAALRTMNHPDRVWIKGRPFKIAELLEESYLTTRNLLVVQQPVRRSKAQRIRHIEELFR